MATLSALSFLFYATYKAYSTLGTKHELLGKVPSELDFIILTFTSFFEPDPLPWFPRWSTGMKGCFTLQK
ncbi:MAG: hypothetical protein AAF353_16015, partial [Pseudomonadota bacterium]